VRLTQWTDYSLRVLMYCAATQGRDALPTVAEIAQTHGISRSHLTKIVMTLSAQGWLETTRGRGGGLRLLLPAAQIRVGDVVRQTEADFQLVECFDPASSHCRMDGRCRLQGVLQQAMQAFLAVLDGVTLADLVAPAPAATARVRWVPGLPHPALLSARPLAE
jgi:Rrf2 family transcriptional regulator, nitric oxide-sensitive transcriptional repressor